MAWEITKNIKAIDGSVVKAGTKAEFVMAAGDSPYSNTALLRLPDGREVWAEAGKEAKRL
jgi:hypothetical protein